jgi:hypothetical protein
MNVSLLGARAGTPDAEALCRGDMKGANIWDYFKSTSPELTQTPQMPSSPPRPLSARNKSVCVAGGRNRPSAVVQNLRRGTSYIEEAEFDEGTRPSSALNSDLEGNPWQIKIAPTSFTEEDLCLPPLVSKDHLAESQTGAKLSPPSLKDLQEKPSSRRPSMDSIVSTAPSESDIIRV